MRKKSVIEIVQLTDTHLFADPSAGLYGLCSLTAFQAVITAIKERNFDVVVATGDLVHDETEAGYRLLKESLATLNKPVYLMPGNHDDPAAMAPILDDMVSAKKRVHLGDWQLLLLNTQHAGQVGGHLSDEELEWLESTLVRYANLFTVVCLHHQPVSMGARWLDQIALDNPDRLFQVLSRHPRVKALLWGHVHQEHDEERAGVRLLACPSTCIQFKPGQDEFALDAMPPGYRWLRLFPDGRLDTGVERLPAIPGTLDPTVKGY